MLIRRGRGRGTLLLDRLDLDLLGPLDPLDPVDPGIANTLPGDAARGLLGKRPAVEGWPGLKAIALRGGLRARPLRRSRRPSTAGVRDHG
jgi:hypothetical protein